LVAVWLPLAETATVTLGVSCFEVYSTGCSIAIKGFARQLDPQRSQRHMGLAGPGSGMRLGVIWSDGTQISSDARPSPGLPKGPTLLGGATGSGGDTYQEMNAAFWMWPLPPAGEMKLIADWPEQNIPEHSLPVDAGPILAAVERVVRVWDDDRPTRPDTDWSR